LGHSCDHHQCVLKQNTASIQLIVQKRVIKPVDTMLEFSVAFLMVIKHKIVLSLKSDKLRRVFMVYWMPVVDTNPVMKVG